MPLCKKLFGDSNYRHTRNSNIKDQIYIDEFKGANVRTICYRLDHKNVKKRIYCPKFSLNEHVAQHDTWLHYKKDVDNGTLEEIFAAVHVSPDN